MPYPAEEMKQMLSAIMGYGAVALSLIWLAFLLFCQLTWLPILAIITVLPPWFWSTLGGLLLLVSLRSQYWKSSFATAALWGLFLVSFCEEPWAIFSLHREWQEQKTVENGLRVITMNCSVGNMAVVHEALEKDPDILVVEESPSKEELLELQTSPEDLNIVYGMDVSIIAHGEIQPIDANRDRKLTISKITLDGVEILVAGLRLDPPHFSLSPWNPAEWSRATSSQRNQVEDMKRILVRIAAVRDIMPLIIAGDFNAPVGSPVYSLLSEYKLADAFRESGIGLGNTILNTLPVARIDQIWLSEEFIPHVTVTHKTINSDHRMVICDISIKAP